MLKNKNDDEELCCYLFDGKKIEKKIFLKQKSKTGDVRFSQTLFLKIVLSSFDQNTFLENEHEKEEQKLMGKFHSYAG